VYATDASGTADPTPADYTWTTTAPPTSVHGTTARISVRIVGKPIVGNRVTAVVHPATKSIRYRWSACVRRHCSRIRTATARSLRIRSLWINKRLEVTVVEVRSGRRATAQTAPVRGARSSR
jgi:hypothetical protein